MQLTVTAAGIAALIAAQNNGTNAVLVSQIGLTAAAFDPESAHRLPAEIKRITTFAGEAVSADTIHVNIADDSADTFTLRGFALYLDDGTVFALYGNPVLTTIIEKSTAATMLLSCDVRFARIDATQITFGDSTWTNPPASETVLGVSRRATRIQAIGGTATDVTMSPAGDKAAMDFRFGENSPSAYIKDLLAISTAVLLRIAIGIKDVATMDMGAGNGIDSDKLDGQEGAYYLNYNNLAGRPVASIPLSDKGVSNGVATLGIDGKVLSGQLPAIAITDVFEVPSQAAMLALSAQRGDVAVRSDINLSFIHNGGSAGTGADWTQLKTPTDAVLSVAGRTGAISLGVSDVGGLQSSLDSKANISGANFTGTVRAPKFADGSSRRYKKEIRSIDTGKALDLLLGIDFKAYVLRADGTRDMGTIAEDLADGPLDFVVGRTANGDPENVHYRPLFVLSCVALQGLSRRVAELEAKA